MHYRSLNTAILRLTQGVGTLKGRDIEWVYSNIPLDEERLRYPNYIFVQINSINSINRDIQGAFVQRQGSLVFFVRTVANAGSAASNDIVEGLAELFENKSIIVEDGQLVLGVMDVQEFGVTSFLVKQIIIPFNYYPSG